MRTKTDHHATLLFAIIVIAALPFHGHSQSYKFDHLTLKDGLSQITVNSIFQDSQGYMWFGTQDGLNQYDAYTFKHFKSDPNDKNSLSHNWIWDIFEDRNHNLWIATWSGLNKISPDRSTITRYYPDQEKEGSIRGERSVSIQESENGMIWIGTWGGGLNMYNPATDSFTCFSKAIKSWEDLPGDYIRAIHIDIYDNIWIGSWTGLWQGTKTDSGEINFKYFDLVPGKEKDEIKITSIASDPGGNIWVGTLGMGVFQLSNNGQNIENYNSSKSLTKLNNNQISNITSDGAGNIWIGTVSHGICVLDPQTDQINYINNDPENPESLSANNVNTIYRDKSGLIWIGTKGLSIYNPSQNKFNSNTDLIHFRRDIQSIKNISAIAQDNSDRIWVGTNGNGIYRLSIKPKNINEKWVEKALKSLDKSNIGSIVRDNEDNIWIGTRGNGLIKLSMDDQELTNIVEYPDNIETHGLNFINGLAFIPPSTLYIATYDKGLISYNTQEKTYKRFHFQSDIPDSFPANYLLRIFKDKMNKLWICTWGAGVINFDPENQSWKSFSNIPDDPTSLADNIPHAICETNKNNKRKIWIGTRKGLSCLDLSNNPENIFTNYYPSDGLPGSIINAIIEDSKSNLWLSSNSGLTRFSPDSMIFLNFKEHDGLQGNEFNAGAGIQLSDERLMFGGVNGFNIFHPDSIKHSNFNPDIVITSVKVFDDEINYNPESPVIKLSYKENFVSFEFASLDYAQSSQNQYKYQMSGIDKDWVFSNNRRYASYTDIDPGNFTFKVAGTNSDGIWSDKMAEFHIEITPPYWQTWWFRIAMGLLFSAIIYSFMYYRIQKIRDIERLRVRIASDLHDDIGSSLTRITIHSQQIQNNKDKNIVESSIEKIGELSREIISTMSDIVWSIDARNDTLTDMLDRIHDFAYDTLSENDIAVSFHEEGMDKNKKIDVLLRQNIFSIFKESVNNIVKYAEADKVEIELKNYEKVFQMKISDNGKGFDEERIKKGNGLQNMKMRAKRIGATLDILNSHGTIIYLQAKSL